MDYLAYSASRYPLGFNFTLALTSSAPLRPTNSPTLASPNDPVDNRRDLMVHPTANSAPRPRYVIVRKRVYVPPRDELDSPDRFFEPAYENTEEKLRAQASYKEFFGRYYSTLPVFEERLLGPCIVLALVNFFGVVACLIDSWSCYAFGEWFICKN